MRQQGTAQTLLRSATVKTNHRHRRLLRLRVISSACPYLGSWHRSGQTGRLEVVRSALGLPSGCLRKIKLSWAPGKVIGGEDYLLQMTIPNTFFHIAMAYAILRHNGIDVGKMDFLGPINLVDA